MDIKVRLPKEYVKVDKIDLDKFQIVYDLKTLPKGVNVKDVLDLYFGSGVLLYNSSNGGEKPSLYLRDVKEERNK